MRADSARQLHDKHIHRHNYIITGAVCFFFFLFFFKNKNKNKNNNYNLKEKKKKKEKKKEKKHLKLLAFRLVSFFLHSAHRLLVIDAVSSSLPLSPEKRHTSKYSTYVCYSYR